MALILAVLTLVVIDAIIASPSAPGVKDPEIRAGADLTGARSSVHLL
jgi:energy-converting hydrogenase Eha subunit B